MKTKASSLLIAAGLLALQTSRAVTLADDVLTVTGTIYQGEGSDPSAVLPKMTMTIASILKLLGITDVDPSTLSYFNSDGGIVLAPSDSKAGDDVTPVVVVFKRKPTAVVQTGDATGVDISSLTAFDGVLKGSQFETLTFDFGNIKNTAKIYAGGKIDGNPVIVKARVADAYTAQ